MFGWFKKVSWIMCELCKYVYVDVYEGIVDFSELKVLMEVLVIVWDGSDVYVWCLVKLFFVY